jgi:ABC-type Mn2+/Zn2+ transport system ATPase subunit
MNSNYQIKVQDLCLGYSKVPLVNKLNLRILQGGFWAVVGPNGQGKSSFIKSLMGLVVPLSGDISYQGLKRNEIGYVPQSSSQSSILSMTALEFVSLPALGLPFSQVRKDNIEQALRKTHIWQKRHRIYANLSGGERQSLHIARALVRNPKLIILDEPDTGLDFIAVENLTKILQALNTEQGITIILITHNIITARETTKKTLLISQGFVKTGTTAEVLTNENIARAFSLMPHLCDKHSKVEQEG